MPLSRKFPLPECVRELRSREYVSPNVSLCIAKRPEMRRGHGRPAPCQELFLFRRLEGIPQRELDQSRCSHRTGDSAEVAAFHVGESRVGEVGVVPNVKEISSEPQFLPLGNLEVLDQREVPVLLPWSAEGVASQVSEAGGAEVGVVHGI